jgi:hypothetical protein
MPKQYKAFGLDDGATQADRRNRLAGVPKVHRAGVEAYAKRLYAASRL